VAQVASRLDSWRVMLEALGTTADGVTVCRDRGSSWHDGLSVIGTGRQRIERAGDRLLDGEEAVIHLNGLGGAPGVAVS